jgi:hypothetical protein
MTDICPYTGLPNTIFSKEHIFPHALGGGLGYSIRVSQKANNELGSSLDAALAHSPAIQRLRLQHGIRSRSGGSGEPEWRLPATLMPRNVEAEFVFRSDGSVEQRILKPVESYDEQGGALILSADQADEFMEQFIAGQKKKGREIIIRDRIAEPGSYYVIDIAVDLLMLKRSMCKIAFGALYEYLGDKFIVDPFVAEWRQVLFSKDRSQIENSRIHGGAFLGPHVLDLLIPDLDPHEHGVGIVNLDKNLTVCAVRLFGTEFYNLLVVASETSNLGLDHLQGIVVVCDAKTRKITRKDFFTEVLPQVSHNLDRLNGYPVP